MDGYVLIQEFDPKDGYWNTRERLDLEDYSEDRPYPPMKYIGGFFRTLIINDVGGTTQQLQSKKEEVLVDITLEEENEEEIFNFGGSSDSGGEEDTLDLVDFSFKEEEQEDNKRW